MTKKVLIFLSVFCFSQGVLFSQNATVGRQYVQGSLFRKDFQKSGDIFGTRNFIENKGQFDGVLPGKEAVLFYYCHNGEKIYLTREGLVFELEEPPKIKKKGKEEEEEEEREGKQEKRQRTFIKATWVGANQNALVETSEKQNHYFTYGDKSLNSYTYKKVTYKGIYKSIDLEIIIPEDKSSGIKYSFILAPGADVTQIGILYTGEFRKKKDPVPDQVELVTPFGTLVEHRPLSYYEDKTEIRSAFKMDGDIIRFSFPDGIDNQKGLVIDPWVTAVSSLGGSNSAFDVDYDLAGNTYIYGGPNNGPYQIARYNAAGTLQWTFSGNVASQSWNNNGSASNFGVDKFTGKSYTGQGVVGSGARVIRVDAAGNYDNYITTANGQYREIWDFGFHCVSGEVFVFGGTTATNLSAATISSVSATLNVATFQPTLMSAGQDIACYAIDDLGKIFVAYGAAFTMNNKLCLVNPTFNGNIWTMPSGFSTLGENANKGNYQPSVTSNGFNCLAVNNNYLFYYDGLNLAAYSKLTGVNIASTTVSGMTAKRQGGIAVDECNILYIGGNGSILTYSFTGSGFTSLTPIALGINTPTSNVHDIKLNKNTKVLYVCGTGFVGTYSAILSMSCAPFPGICVFNTPGIGASTSSITCATLGSATVSASGLGPYSYTWIPSGLTGPVATSLSPGTYTVAVYDAGYNITYTTTTTFLSAIPLTGSVSSTFMLACAGVPNGTAAITNLSGGSGNQSYLWTNGTNTYTSASVGNLSAGNYSVTVTDALTGCVYNPTFTIYQPPLFSSFISASSPSVCTGGSVDLFVNAFGGVPAYTYSWVSGPSGSSLQVSQNSAGNYSYTAVCKDLNNCTSISTISIDFVPNPTLSVSNVSICPLEAGTLTVSGASTYTWLSSTQSATGSNFVQSPSVNTQYTVIGSALSCSASSTSSIVIKPVPNPIFSSNSPKCQGENLLFTVNTGTNFSWTGAGNYISNSQSNTLSICHPTQSGVYQVTVTAANSCTAATQGTVTIHPTPTVAALGATVCVNQNLQLSANSSQASNFVWTGPNFVSLLQNPSIANPPVTASGNYSVLVTSAQSCTNRAVANVTVTAMPVISFGSNSPQCFGKTVNFNASATSGGTNFLWAGPNNFSSTLQNPVITNVTVPASGNYTLTVSTGPCTVFATHMVTIHPLPMPVSYNSGPVCEGKSFQLGVNNSGVTYLWWGPNAFVSTAQNLNFAPAQLNHSGVYTVQVTDANGCQAIDLNSVTVMPNPVVHAFGDMVCFGTAAQLSASGADSYQWYGPLGFTAQGASAQIPAAYNTLIWTYTVIGTGVNGCTTTATSTIGTRPLPIASMSITPKVCVKTTVYLKGEGGLSFLWSGPLNYNSTLQNPSFVAQNMGAAGEYSLMVTDAYGCRGYTKAALLVDPEPGANIIGRSNGCVPFCSDYSLSAVNTLSLQNVHWQLNDFTKDVSKFNYCFSQSGTFELKADFESENNCKGNLVHYIEVYPLPEADFVYSPLKPVENQDQVLFLSNSTGVQLSQWTWSFNDGRNLDQQGPSSSRLFETSGIYVVVLQVKNSWDCMDTVIKTVEVMTDFNVYVPNAFTPNGDGLNDSFYPVMRGVKQFELQVFDRWGAMIFATNTKEKVWDGTFKGQACKQDVYNYKMVLLNNKGEEKEYNGTVMLYR